MCRSIQLLPGGGPERRLSKHGKGSLGVGGVSREPYGVSEDGGAKYIHCVEEAGHQQGGDDKGRAGVGVVIEWARRAAAMGGDAGGGVDVQEVLVKCRVGQFPSRKGFYLLVSTRGVKVDSSFACFPHSVLVALTVDCDTGLDWESTV